MEITNGQIEVWIRNGTDNGIKSMLQDRYGVGEKLKSAIESAIKESQPQIVSALQVAISQACVSPKLLKSIENDIVASLTNQYRGAFEGVIRAAAKQAANNEIIAKRVAELTREAAGL